MSIYKNTPAFHERAAHIAEKAMRIRKRKDVGSITGVISAQPINELGQAIGAAMTFSSVGTKYSHMTNQNCNTVHLLIKNKTRDGGTAAVSGRFYNTAS